MFHAPSPEEIRQVEEHYRYLERSGVLEIARAARRDIALLFPDGFPAYLRTMGLTPLLAPQREIRDVDPPDARLQPLRARIAERMAGGRWDHARGTAMRVAERLFADPREWLNSQDISKLNLSKDTVYSALRQQPGACRGGQETRAPLEFNRLAVLEYVVATWKPKRSSKSA